MGDETDRHEPVRPKGRFETELETRYQAFRARLGSNPDTLMEFDEFMSCQRRAFGTAYLLMKPYIEWLTYQYWLIMFFALVSVYYLFEPISVWYKLFTLYFFPFYFRRLFLAPIKSLTARQDIGKILIGMIFSAMMVTMWSPIMYYTILDQQAVSHAVVGCTGIEDHYHAGANFAEDYYIMKHEYLKCYDSNEYHRFYAVPADIDGCRREMDCDDFAYMVSMCLAPLHNFTCVPSVSLYLEYKVPAEDRMDGHIGLRCREDALGDDGTWYYLD